jgi:hypothetical protein
VDGWTILSRVADSLSIVTTALAFAGLAAFWLSRPRVKITVYLPNPPESYVTGPAGARVLLKYPSEARVLVEHIKGSADLHDFWQWLIVNSPEGGYGGDGQLARTLYPKQSWQFVIHELQDQTYGGERTTGIQASVTSTVTLALRWQRPVLRWTSTSWRVVLWTPEDRAAGKPPKVLRGRPAALALRAAERESYRYPGD